MLKVISEVIIDILYFLLISTNIILIIYSDNLKHIKTYCFKDNALFYAQSPHTHI